MTRPVRPRLVAFVTCVACFTIAACGGGEPQALPRFPSAPVPERVGDLTVEEEASAPEAFASAGAASMVEKGKVFTMRRDGEVQAALQISQLEPRYDTDEIEVRRGVRTYIERGRYRWFKMEGHWVGVQELREVKLYLWFPRRDLFEILQVRPDVAAPDDLLRAVIVHQKGALA